MKNPKQFFFSIPLSEFHFAILPTLAMIKRANRDAELQDAEKEMKVMRTEVSRSTIAQQCAPITSTNYDNLTDVVLGYRFAGEVNSFEHFNCRAGSGLCKSDDGQKTLSPLKAYVLPEMVDLSCAGAGASTGGDGNVGGKGGGGVNDGAAQNTGSAATPQAKRRSSGTILVSVGFAVALITSL